ncbi:hypothetical protein GCM10010439_05570 [Actinocorallia aurantiaca]|uniref:Uncharacterized protein n=1 Tax=Actinocorallia aurantiaca TaxID=46204 RepID=A0ABN3TVZ0_9ACTN
MAHTRVCVTVSLLIGDLGYPKTEHSERVTMTASAMAVHGVRLPGKEPRALSTGTEREFS